MRGQKEDAKRPYFRADGREAPLRSNKDASRHVVFVAATPPRSGGECGSSSIHS